MRSGKEGWRSIIGGWRGSRRSLRWSCKSHPLTKSSPFREVDSRANVSFLSFAIALLPICSVEHLNGPSFHMFPQMVFGTFRPRIVLISTPNFEVRTVVTFQLSERSLLRSSASYSSTLNSLAAGMPSIRIPMVRRASWIQQEGQIECSGYVLRSMCRSKCRN